MSDENKPASPDAGKSTDADMVQIDKAELEGLRANQEVFKEIEERAIEADFTGVKDYVEQTEAWAYDKVLVENNEPAEPQKQVETPKTETPPAPAPAVIPQKELERIGRAENMAVSAFMQTCYTAYDAENKGRPEDERSSHTKETLLKVINGRRKGSVNYLVANDNSFSNNPYLAAEFILNRDADSKRRKEETAKSNEALNKAEETAKIDSTTVSAPAPPDDKSDNDKLADEIAPDDPEVVIV